MNSSRMVSALAALLLAGCAPALITPAPAGGPPPVIREFRGVWVAAVSNIDWPSRPGLPVDSQKAELIRLLDRTKELNLNAFILHVRTAGDALDHLRPLERDHRGGVSLVVHVEVEVAVVAAGEHVSAKLTAEERWQVVGRARMLTI